jgi:hypothetical protein
MSNSNIDIEFSDEFKHNLSVLCKKYRSIRNDIKPILDQGNIVAKEIRRIINNFNS